MEVIRVALKTWNPTCEGLVGLYLSPGPDTEPGRLMVKMQAGDSTQREKMHWFGVTAPGHPM